MKTKLCFYIVFIFPFIWVKKTCYIIKTSHIWLQSRESISYLYIFLCLYIWIFTTLVSECYEAFKKHIRSVQFVCVLSYNQELNAKSILLRYQECLLFYSVIFYSVIIYFLWYIRSESPGSIYSFSSFNQVVNNRLVK